MNLSCFVSGRTPILYPFIERAVQLTVSTIGTSHCYQLQTQSYQHSGKVKLISKRKHVGPICGFRPKNMKYWLDILHLSDTTEKMGIQWGSFYDFRTALWFSYEASFVPSVRAKSKDKFSNPQNGNQKSVQLPSRLHSFIISLYFATLLSSTFRSLLLFAKNLLTEKKIH